MSMFQERIKSALRRAAPGQGENQESSALFDQVLEEFVETLMGERPCVRACVERGQLPPMRTILTWPRIRRDHRNVILAFWWKGTTMRVLAESERAPFATPEELSDYLVDFLDNPSLMEKLAEYERDCREDTTGYLRAHEFFAASRDDVMVRVAAREQRKLADARPGATVSLLVVQDRMPSTAEYGETATYSYLSSGGFGLRVATHRVVDGRIHISGVVMAEEETA
jgi:hypothetical protein